MSLNGKRAILLLTDPKDNSFSCIEHNLSISDAVCEVRCMRKKGMPAFFALQKTIHNDNHAETCTDCIAAVSIAKVIRQAS